MRFLEILTANVASNPGFYLCSMPLVVSGVLVLLGIYHWRQR